MDKGEVKNNEKYSIPIYENDALLAVVFGKLLCRLGWHKWRYKLQDAIGEFGALPLDSRMPKTAKCDRCLYLLLCVCIQKLIPYKNGK